MTGRIQGQRRKAEIILNRTLEKVQTLMQGTQKYIIAVYIITMTVAFTTQYGDYTLGYHLAIVIAALWCGFILLKAIADRFQARAQGNWEEWRAKWGDISFLLVLYLLPSFLIHMYSFILVLIGEMPPEYITTNLTVYIPTVLAILAVYLFGMKVVEYTLMAILGSWILSVCSSLVTKGIMIFPQAIVQGYIDPGAHIGGLRGNYLELHDVVMGLGYFLISAVFLRMKMTRKRFLLLAFLLLISILGMKRIAVPALLAAILFDLLFHRVPDRYKYRICIVSGCIAVVLCYIFVYLVSNGQFFELMDQLGVNLMGRNYYYTDIMKYAEFSPGFLGIGRNVTYRIFSGELAYLRVGGTHSDIIKMYVENGFIMFGLWLCYYLVCLTVFFKKRFGEMSAYLHFGIIIYMFILFLTDNTENYFICQIASIMLPVSYALSQKDRTEIS